MRSENMIKAIPITDPEQMAFAQSIRKRVFVDEQKVPAEAEIDEFEDSSRHYLAIDEHNYPIGTARWRTTSKGIKLERFAVLKETRKSGAGKALLQKMLEDIRGLHSDKQKNLYLHAQVGAMLFYKKFGFEPVGERFEECGIEHYEMTRQL